MNLKHSQLDVDNWIEHGVRYFNELTNTTRRRRELSPVVTGNNQRKKAIK
jgi:hypothetical protein